MRVLLWLLLVAANAASARALWLAWQDHERPLPPVDLRGLPMRSASQSALEPEPPPLFDDEGQVRLAGLAIPGYDPPELRPDPSPLGRDRLPEAIAALHGREVTVTGYPLPYDGDREGTRAVLLSLNPPGCCFGLRPVLDEWIEVRGAKAWQGLDPGQLTTFRGLLEVEELQDEDGYALSLYRMPVGELVGTR